MPAPVPLGESPKEVTLFHQKRFLILRGFEAEEHDHNQGFTRQGDA